MVVYFVARGHAFGQCLGIGYNEAQRRMISIGLAEQARERLCTQYTRSLVLLSVLDAATVARWKYGHGLVTGHAA